MSQQDFKTVQEYWASLQPELCKGCECSELDFTQEGDPFWICALHAQDDSCYKEPSTSSKGEGQK